MGPQNQTTNQKTIAELGGISVLAKKGKATSVHSIQALQTEIAEFSALNRIGYTLCRNQAPLIIEVPEVPAQRLLHQSQRVFPSLEVNLPQTTAEKNICVVPGLANGFQRGSEMYSQAILECNRKTEIVVPNVPLPISGVPLVMDLEVPAVVVPTARITTWKRVSATCTLIQECLIGDEESDEDRLTCEELGIAEDRQKTVSRSGRLITKPQKHVRFA
ncbi:hypothetical protein BDR26DRAFT_943857 [Obelidium mucronatum]|nr:hypothetical protein BDR26DRAFT_943857 [Obelidium mucronatum]